MSGAFFTEGSFSKNTPEEVQEMMNKLEQWSTLAYREGPLEVLLPEEKISRINYESAQIPLTAMAEAIDIQRYMGRWHVQANIPTYFDKGTINNTEDYTWDEKRQIVLVSFKYSAQIMRSEGEGDARRDVVAPGPVQEILQHGTLLNEQGTEWALKVKLLFYVPVPVKYLVLAINEGLAMEEPQSSSRSEDKKDMSLYQSCMIGVTDRSALWIMTRNKAPMKEEELAAYLLKANLLGYDVSKIGRVPIVEPIQ
jgi:lipocalin